MSLAPENHKRAWYFFKGGGVERLKEHRIARENELQEKGDAE